MPAKRIIPSESILHGWAEAGMTQEQMRQRIYEDTGVLPGKSTVSAALSRAGLTHKVRYDDFIPWKRIAVEHNQHYILNQLRVGARLARGMQVRPADKRRYEQWRADVDAKNASIHYDPDTVDGFFYVPRPEGGDLIYLPES